MIDTQGFWGPWNVGPTVGDFFMAIQPPPPLTYPPQKQGFNKALLRETNG